MKVNFLGIDVEIEKFKKSGVECVNIKTSMGLFIRTQQTHIFNHQDNVIINSNYPVENITKTQTFDGDQYTLEFSSFEDKFDGDPRIICLLKYK